MFVTATFSLVFLPLWSLLKGENWHSRPIFAPTKQKHSLKLHKLLCGSSAPGSPPSWHQAVSLYCISWISDSQSEQRRLELQWGCYVFLPLYLSLFQCPCGLWFTGNSLSLREVWLSPPAQDHLCWRISAHVFFVDLLIAASYRSWRSEPLKLSQCVSRWSIHHRSVEYQSCMWTKQLSNPVFPRQRVGSLPG